MALRNIKDNAAMFLVSAFLVIGALAVGARFLSPQDDALVEVKVPALSPQAEMGRAVFQENCSVCHGANGAGSRQGPPLIHDIYNPGHHDDEAFYRAAQSGSPRHHWNFGDMPEQPQVGRQHVAQIIRYIRELQRANGIFYKPHTM